MKGNGTVQDSCFGQPKEQAYQNLLKYDTLIQSRCKETLRTPADFLLLPNATLKFHSPLIRSNFFLGGIGPCIYQPALKLQPAQDSQVVAQWNGRPRKKVSLRVYIVV